MVGSLIFTYTKTDFDYSAAGLCGRFDFDSVYQKCIGHPCLRGTLAWSADFRSAGAEASHSKFQILLNSFVFGKHFKLPGFILPGPHRA